MCVCVYVCCAVGENECRKKTSYTIIYVRLSKKDIVEKEHAVHSPFFRCSGDLQNAVLTATGRLAQSNFVAPAQLKHENTTSHRNPSLRNSFAKMKVDLPPRYRGFADET